MNLFAKLKKPIFIGFFIYNTYSIEECESRLEDLVDRLYNVVAREGISRLKVVNVADTIQGILRITDLKLNEIAVVESVVQISRLLATFINRVSEYCEVEYYHCTHANHSQKKKKPFSPMRARYSQSRIRMSTW